MKTRMISAVMAAFMLATASVGGITASAAERASAEERTAETTAVDDEESSAETTETTASEPADKSSTVTESSDDMEKFREVMSELAEAETTDVVPDYDGDPYYHTMFADYPDLVDVNQLCEMLGLKYKTVCKFIREGKIPRMPDGRKIRVAKIEVINYVLQRAQK